MNTGKWIGLAVSSFITIGNSQDAGEAPATPITNFYGSQGNVATNRTLLDSEMNRAVEEARQKKALMAAMAAQSQAQQPVATNAESFLAANKPNWPTPPPSESGPLESPPRSYAPPSVPNYTQPATIAAGPDFEPAAKPGLFSRLLKKDEGEDDFTNNPYISPPPAATYQNTPPSLPEPPPVSPEEMAARDAAMLNSVSAPEAVELPGQEEKGGFFGKLFKRSRSETAPADSIPVPAQQADLPPEMAEVPALPEEPANAPIPEPAPFETAAATPPPVPAPATAPSSAPVDDIFSRRTSGDSSTSDTATVTSEAQAEVGGVLVTLYEGTSVGVISRDGGTTKIRLKDQRVGTIKSSVLR